ncbi:MAG: glycosyltransferase family 39 protein, partial [Acidobacteria bacterium]|nr:glycosyltransferase family 39 protein [Acidobacteriota bacterium]
MKAVRSDNTRRLSGYYLILLLILLIGMLGRGFHFYLTLGSDDQRWIIAARALTGTESVSIPVHFYPRIVWRCVLALWGLPWGLTLEISAILMFLLAAISIVLVALIARLLFSERASLLAAAFHATYPINVQFDPTTLPDGLAVPLMLLAVFLFARFLKDRRTGLLAGSAFTAGVLFAVKEYFVLITVPFGLCLLFSQLGFKEKKRYLTVLVLFFTLGFSVDFLLHAVESQDPIAHFRPLLTYSARYEAFLSQGQANPSTLHQIYYLVHGRFDYFRWVL